MVKNCLFQFFRVKSLIAFDDRKPPKIAEPNGYISAYNNTRHRSVKGHY